MESYGVYLRNTPRAFWRLSLLVPDSDTAHKAARGLVAQAHANGQTEAQAAVTIVPLIFKADVGRLFKPCRHTPVTTRVYFRGDED